MTVEAPDRAPARRAREELAACRDRGLDFEGGVAARGQGRAHRGLPHRASPMARGAGRDRAGVARHIPGPRDPVVRLTRAARGAVTGYAACRHRAEQNAACFRTAPNGCPHRSHTHNCFTVIRFASSPRSRATSAAIRRFISAAGTPRSVTAQSSAEDRTGRRKPRLAAHNWRKISGMSSDARNEPRPEWLTASEAAIAVGVSASTVRRWVARGILPSFQAYPGSAVRVSAKALELRRREPNA